MMTLALWALLLTSPAQHLKTFPAPLAPAKASPTSALTPAQVRERVWTYLNSIDTPIPESDWAALGVNAAPPLEAIIDDAQNFSIRRARALSALALVSPKTAGSKAVTLAKNGQEPYIVRAAAMRAAAKVLPPAQLQRQLLPVLQKDPDLEVRASAGSALAHHPAGCRSVRAQVALERPENHPRFHDALERCATP